MQVCLCAYDLSYNTLTCHHYMSCPRDTKPQRIDDQLWRQNHRSEVEATWHNKNDPLLDQHVVPDNFEFGEEMIVQDNGNNYDHVMILNRQLEKDKRMARNNPSAYCADRCLATGNCDVWEDVFHLSPTEVMAFCHDCVLSDGEEPCDIPPHMLEEGFAKLKP